MIVVTVGTNEQPFDRLVGAAAALEGDEPLLVQHGASTVRPGRGEWVAFLPFEELATRIAEADAVVCHAGVGSIMVARRCGHRPIVVPRRVHLGEAVDDHQLPLARRLAAAGLVTLVEDVADLARALRSKAAPRTALSSGLPGAAALSADVRHLLIGLGTRSRLAPAAQQPPSLVR
jgi:UDP-N-acetylglucosamine transferase subunit ALG13